MHPNALVHRNLFSFKTALNPLATYATLRPSLLSTKS